MDRTLTMTAALVMLLAVGAGAFGAHALRGFFDQHQNLEGTYETAVRYQMIHGLAMFVSAWAAAQWQDSLVTWSGWLFFVGIIIFSGSLYLLVLTGTRWLGAVTPVGGLAFIGGWLLLFLSVWRG